MKRILPYILIVLIFVQLFAPFSVGSGVKINKAIAEVTASSVGISSVDLSDKNATVSLFAQATEDYRNNTLKNYDDLYLVVKINNADGTLALPADKQNISNFIQDFKSVNVTGVSTFAGLTPSTTYGIVATVEGVKAGATTTLLTSIPTEKTTLALGNTEQLPQGGDVSGMPICGIGIGILGSTGTIGGCAAQLLYYVLFVPTSYIFALAGTFFDFTFHYSVQDGSYRTPFVVEGWGIVRDFCNMFFIFIMLYIAIGTILKLHSVKTKEMIINVVIIGLLINFSLFATQVIVDASNILARVFYNSNTITITQGEDAKNGVTEATPKLKIGPNGEIPLSAAIVNKVNPQNLIINGRKVVVIQDKTTGQTADSETEGNLGTGAFILITLLAVAVNIMGIIAFLSIGLVFVARVIGLWMAMIFAPFAFFSYTVPAMHDWSFVGWKNWWPETLKLAFLAPIFIFFMYLIIMFLEKGLSLVNSNDTATQDGMTFVISIIVPFIFIMILMMKAKDIAKKMSGTMGQSITNGLAAVGGIALGGAALGTAFMGRRLIGAGLASTSRSEGAMNRGTQKFEYNKKLEDWKAKGGVGNKPKWSDHVADYEAKSGKKLEKGLFTRLGANLNAKQMQIGGVDHARHEIDQAKKSAGLEGIDDVNLSGVDEKKIKDEFMKGKKSEIESDIRKGYDAKKEIALIDDKGNKVMDGNNEIKGEEQYKKAKRSEVEKTYMNENGISEAKDLTDKDKKNIENQLNANFNVVLKATIKNESEHKYDHIREESRQHIGGAERAFSRANKGSYDVRNLSGISSDKREGFLTKVPVALIAGIATGVRAGMKNVGTNNGGIKVQGDFMKDLSNVVSDSLKSAKVSVDLSHVGEHKSSADAHGGDHGGGHH